MLNPPSYSFGMGRRQPMRNHRDYKKYLAHFTGIFGHSMKHLAFCLIALSLLLITSQGAFCSETYFIDNNRVLLYKIINWWYDCLSEESTQLCGSLIKCRNKGDARVRYDETRKFLQLQINGGFANLLSIFKNCEQCFGPSHLKCTWLNKKYFGGGKAAIISNEVPAISGFTFHGVDKDHSRIIQSIESEIELELEGKVGGLLNGKIALHKAGNSLKSCPDISQDRADNFITSLKFINSHTKEILAEYSVVFQH